MIEKAVSTTDEDVALRAILEATARSTGERFFDALVETLSKSSLYTWLMGDRVPACESPVQGSRIISGRTDPQRL
jgi:hypothetical protein